MGEILKNIVNICKKYNINKALLFGSRARGDHNYNSDYDVAIWCNENDRTSITSEINEIETLYKIDLVFIDGNTDKIFLNNILKDGINIMNKHQIKIKNYNNAVSRLKEAIEEYNVTKSKTVRDGVIQRFEFTAELAWKSLREYLIEQGFQKQDSPKSVMKEAFAASYITDEHSWLSILNDRNLTSHIYDDSTAERIYNRIVNEHLATFNDLSSFYNK